MNKVLLAMVLLSICPKLSAWVSGYTRLFKPDTKTTVDFVYDLHECSSRDSLFPSEEKLGEVLADLNQMVGKIDLIWESRPEGGPAQLQYEREPQFIGIYPLYICENLKNLNFIHGDTCRTSGYAALFNSKFKTSNRAGSTFEQPFPFGFERQSIMRLNAGRAVLDAYRALYSQTVADLTSYFSAYMTGTPVEVDRDFYNNPVFLKIADLELLYHILVSTKQRIIVYCGGWHGPNMTSFLQRNGYVVLQSKERASNTVNANDLDVETRPEELDFLFHDGIEQYKEQLKNHNRSARADSPAAAAAPVSSSEESVRAERKQCSLNLRLMVQVEDPLLLSRTYRMNKKRFLPQVIEKDYNSNGYSIALGAFDICFDKDVAFDAENAAEILGGALEQSTNEVLKARGAPLSMPFLFFGVNGRSVEALYDTSNEFRRTIAQIERNFRASVPVQALIENGLIIAIENQSDKNMPAVRVGLLNERGPINTVVRAALPPYILRASSRVSARRTWREVA